MGNANSCIVSLLDKKCSRKLISPFSFPCRTVMQFISRVFARILSAKTASHCTGLHFRETKKTSVCLALARLLHQLTGTVYCTVPGTMLLHIILRGFTEPKTNYIDGSALLYDEGFSFSMCTQQYLCKCTTIFAYTIFDPCYLCFFCSCESSAVSSANKAEVMFAEDPHWSRLQQMLKLHTAARFHFFQYWFADSFIYTRKGIRQNSNLSIISKILILSHMSFEHC